MTRVIYLSWLFLALAIGAFALVVYKAQELQAEASLRASLAVDEEHKLDKNAYVQRLQAVVRDTEEERGTLDDFAHLDIVGTVQMLEDAGKSVGVKATVTDATAESGGTELPGGETLQSISFSLTADGSYSALMRAVHVYERLPLASKIMHLDIERAQKGGWHLTLRIRVLAVATSL